MKYRLVLYVSLLVIAIASILGAWLLPVNEIIKTIAGLPFVGALFVALFQLARDHSSFLKEAAKQQRDHTFAVAATSHMSKVVFDKHVEFSELYIKELQNILSKLSEMGPTKKGVEYARSLYKVRMEFRLWISPAMAATLDEFENKILRMGTSLGLMESPKGYDKGLDDAYDLFAEIMELEKEDSNNPEIESKKHKGCNLVIEHLQDILGIKKLTELRDSVISNS
ncbi:MAG: hypothetical protein ACUZ8N_07525 [Candidatus Scalindua sp.]